MKEGVLSGFLVSIPFTTLSIVVFLACVLGVVLVLSEIVFD